VAAALRDCTLNGSNGDRYCSYSVTVHLTVAGSPKAPSPCSTSFVVSDILNGRFSLGALTTGDIIEHRQAASCVGVVDDISQGIKRLSGTIFEGKQSAFNPADITRCRTSIAGAYRSTVCVHASMSTTNWRSLQLYCMSLTFSSESASPLRWVLVGLVTTFLFIEARVTASLIFGACGACPRSPFFGPILRGEALRSKMAGTRFLPGLPSPTFIFTYVEAVGRRLRNNYCWIFTIQVTAYVGKLLIHPAPVASLQEFWMRAAIGPIPGRIRPSRRPRIPRNMDSDSDCHI